MTYENILKNKVNLTTELQLKIIKHLQLLHKSDVRLLNINFNEDELYLLREALLVYTMVQQERENAIKKEENENG